MGYIKSQLSSKYADPVPQDNEKSGGDKTQVVVYATSSFEEYFTYDGIDMCGIRVANEVQSKIDSLNAQDGDGKVVKLSVVAYSLGGLISRFAIGLLYQRGLFETVEPCNYTTFASPHAGTLALGDNLVARLFNKIGPWFLAYTSQQLFLADRLPPSHRPLLETMADPDLDFYKALQSFKSRTLYANVVNDHRTEWYTSGIDTIDPFAHRDQFVRGAYVSGYAPTVLDYSKPVQLGYNSSKGDFVPFIGARPAASSLGIRGRVNQGLRKVKLAFNIFVVVPVWFCCSVVNSVFQYVRASIRKQGFVQSDVFTQFADGLEALLSRPLGAADIGDEEQQLLQPQDENRNGDDPDSVGLREQVTEHAGVVLESVLGAVSQYESIDHYLETSPNTPSSTRPPSPVTDVPSSVVATPEPLPLTKLQRQIIHNLNTLNWTKYAVHIRLATHSHAAIICRFPNPNFREGKTVVRHWVDEVFVA